MAEDSIGARQSKRLRNRAFCLRNWAEDRGRKDNCPIRGGVEGFLQPASASHSISDFLNNRRGLPSNSTLIPIIL